MTTITELKRLYKAAVGSGRTYWTDSRVEALVAGVRSFIADAEIDAGLARRHHEGARHQQPKDQSLRSIITRAQANEALAELAARQAAGEDPAKVRAEILWRWFE